MIYLVIDDVRFKIKFKTTAFETRLKYIDSVISGELHLSDFKIISSDDKLLTPTINNDSDISILINYTVIKLSNFHIILHGDWCVIISKVDNIFEIHETILKAIAPHMVQSLKCFNIFPGCNLRCPYCSQSTDPHSKHDDDFELYKKLIKRDHKISKDLFEKVDIRYMDRIMGDETLLDWNIFKSRLDTILINNIFYGDSFEMYTNGTVPENVERLMNWILTKGIKQFKRFEILVTVDTLDYTTSLRYNTKDLFDKYKETLRILKNYNHYDFINIIFNVMYNDHETFIDTVKKLSDMGFMYYKPGFNERDDSDKYVNNYTYNSSKLYEECSKYITLAKTRNKNDLVYCFYIFEFDKMVYEHKFTFDVGYNAVQYFQSHKTREDGDNSEIWGRFTTGKNVQR